jgi:multidrug efflux pump subunit AcrA (membrane-fusion protein)
MKRPSLLSWKKILAVNLLGALLAGCTGLNPSGTGQQQVLPTSSPIPTAPVAAKPTYIVQRGDVQDTLDFIGRWEPRDQIQLSFPIAGTVRRVSVNRGDTVSPGQLLADFQIDQLESQLQTDQLSLQTAEQNLSNGDVTTGNSVSSSVINLANANLNLQKTNDSSPWPQVESAKIQLDNAQQSLTNAQHAYDDAISRPNNSPQSIDQAYSNLKSAENSLKSAQANYDSAAQNYANYKYSILSAQNGVVQAQSSLNQALSGSTNPTAAQQVQQAQLKIDQDNKQIAQSTLASPISGEVLQVSIKPGDAVKAYDIVIIVGTSEPKEAVATLAIGDAQKLSIGLVGTCQVQNQPETLVQCVVRRVPLTSRDADQTTRVAASMEDFKLRTDTAIEVKMPLQIARNVLWLPPAAIRTFQNRTFVIVQTPQGQREQDITLGLVPADGSRDEIKSGVQEGDVVVAP